MNARARDVSEALEDDVGYSEPQEAPKLTLVRDDELRAARGIANGVLASLVVWAVALAIATIF